MPSAVAVLGTTSSHGGQMIQASGNKLSLKEGAVCLEGDQHSCPIQGHGITPIVSGCATKTNVNGKPIAIQGAVAGCGAVLDGSFGSNMVSS